jgi:hypothetical protein
MRQAVVVIHGIGEQRPMDTVRGFVTAVVPPPENPDKPRFWNKPDPMSEIFELRKLTVPQSASMPPTDFFECYWAYQSEGTKIVHVLAWAKSLLVRKPKEVPKHLQPLWWTLWGLIVGTVVLLSSSRFVQSISLAKRTINANYLLSILSSLALLVITGILVNYLGKAARYLNPSPTNIEMRRSIRSKGVDLLRRLHDAKEKDGSDYYSRIILVGHSLGSVIAYDILRNLWPQFNLRTSDYPPNTDLADLVAMEKAGESLKANPPVGTVKDFRELQRTLWEKELTLGNRWRVTDLVTIGSPLAHGELLLAQKRSELEEREKERELPTCPPAAEDGWYGYDPFHPKHEGGKDERKGYLLHHGAAFACTKWTNLYFPAKLGFFGDLVGGPLREVFGPGILDVAVDSPERGGWLKHTPLIHTHYWNEDTVSEEPPESGKEWALHAVQEAMNLDSRVWLKAIPALLARAAGAGQHPS